MNYVEPREKTLRTWKSGLQLHRAARDTNLEMYRSRPGFHYPVVRAIKVVLGEQMIVSGRAV